MLSQRGLLHPTSCTAVQQSAKLHKWHRHSIRHPMHSSRPILQQHIPSTSTFAHQIRANVVQQQHSSRSTAGAFAAQHVPAAVSIHTKATARPKSFLNDLSVEQQAAVQAQEQHVRVIAGPGSGKTSVVAARVAWCLKQGVRPYSRKDGILVITFTRKAAGELKQRLSDAGLTHRNVQAWTFHALCCNLLKDTNWHNGLHGMDDDWAVADEDDQAAIVLGILQRMRQEDQPSRQPQTDESAPDKENDSDNDNGNGNANANDQEPDKATEAKRKNKEEVDAKKLLKSKAQQYRGLISRMKNFVETTHSQGQPRSGHDILEELRAADAPNFVDMPSDTLAELAEVYDSYQWQLECHGMLDYDDLLHHCLALVHNHPTLLGALHKRWSHVLVDEGQDTNLCQFELVRQITGPRSKLFMVGDPDQAIYGFRGAKAKMLKEKFDKLFTGTSATYYLSDNYRSYSPIISVADGIRRMLRRRSGSLNPGRSKRGFDATNTSVELLAAANQEKEKAAVVQQLRDWGDLGYQWDEMAVLCRTSYMLEIMYNEAVARGIPAELVGKVGFWDKPEVKTALALLRAVVYPMAASEGLKARVVSSHNVVNVPLTTGLGLASIEKLEQKILEANLAKDRSSSSSSSKAGPGSSPQAAELPSSLGGCLLVGCALSMA